jgi:hypothetical protein
MSCCRWRSASSRRTGGAEPAAGRPAAAGTNRAGWAQRGRWHGPADRRPPPSGLIPLTCNEVQHLFAVQVARPSASRPPAALVGLAMPTSSPHPYLPRTTTGPLATMKIAIYGWSTNPSISWWRRACGPGPPMAAGSRDGAARPRHLDQDGAGRLCWRRSARETSGAVGLGRLVARAGGLPTGVPPRGELTAFAAASHLARSGTWE